MSKPVLRARPSVELRDPRVSGALIRTYRSLSPLYLRFALKLRSVRLLGAPLAVEAVRAFQEGGCRLLIAFRHPYGHEPELIASVISRSIPAAARASASPLPKTSHAHFVHGHEVALWSGPLVRWVLPRAGALPVHHVKFDKSGMERIRIHMLDGAYPLALAPEGQVSYTSYSVPRLERGFASIAFRCAEDLEAADRKERVTVLPLSVHFHYGRNAPRTLERALGRLERECGLESGRDASPQARLGSIAEAIIASAEGFYGRRDRTSIRTEHGTSLNDRWAALLGAALAEGERMLDLPPHGDPTMRLYRLRQAGWDRIYRDDLGARAGTGAPPPLFRALADRGAGEAWYAMRHMELVDLGSYLDFESLSENDPIDLLIERANNYLDLTSRLRGGNISDRRESALKDAVIVVGEPLEMRERLGEYRASRKTALDAATMDLEKSYLRCIDLFRKEYDHGER